MRNTQRRIGLVTGLIIISLVGLLAVQGLLLRNAWDQKDQTFRRNVMMVLASVAQKLEARETAKTALASLPPMPAQMRPGTVTATCIATAIDVPDSQTTGTVGAEAELPVRIDNGVIHYTVPRRGRVVVQVYDSARADNRVVVDAVKNPGEYVCKLDDATPAGRSIMVGLMSNHVGAMTHDSIFFKFNTDSNSMVFQVSNGAQITSSYQQFAAGNKRQIVSRMMDQLLYVETEPIERRLSDTLLDSVIKATLNESGLSLKYAFGVIDPRDSISFSHPGGQDPALRKTEFRTRLFPHDMFAPPNELALFFPERTTYLWTQIGPFLGLTSLFMIIIASCFAYTIRTIVRQRRFAQRTADFINNMTHEFKTPISTISLAAEALAKPGKTTADETVHRFGRMIQEENKRMSGQVEKILQMAALEERDYELNLTMVDMHDLMQKAADAVTLRVQGRGGALETSLLADRAFVSGDPVHLGNIIYNLLDNALKYTTDTPVIRLATENRGSDLIIRVEDNGIGIAEKDLKLVFEKYYRVPTGNVHNVKGFGIGLSYVKLMVEAHHGRIQLTSEPGKGTCVELTFPTVPVESE